MSREIKFRFWDGTKMRFSLDGFGPEMDVLVDLWQWFESMEYPVMQFTGLKDKNGVDRFEGDIIRRSTGYVFEEKVKFFGIGPKGSAECYGYDFHDDDEIIGNIYENKDLL